jgi:protein JSN1
VNPPNKDVLQPYKNLWIGNVDHNLTEKQLEDLFAPFGRIERVNILIDKGCAFVNFDSTESAIQARTTLQGHAVNGLPIKV